MVRKNYQCFELNGYILLVLTLFFGVPAWYLMLEIKRFDDAR